MATHSSILAWKVQWTEEPGRLQSKGSQRVRHNWVHTHTNYDIYFSILYICWLTWLYCIPRERTGHIFQSHKRRLYIWTSPDGQHRNQIDYIICSQRSKSSIQSAKTRPGADCGSDHEDLIAKFRLKLKKAGKTTRPFRHDINQIPYDYTEEVRNRFKGLDLIECLINYGMRFVTLYRRQGSRPFPWKRNAKKQSGCLGRPYK